MGKGLTKAGEAIKRAIGVEGSFKEAVLPMLGYNSASILMGGAGYIISLYFMSFLTEVEGLQPAQYGMVVLLAQLWDAVTDPAMGIITDRTRSKYGRHRRYLLWGILPIALSYFMLWNSFGISAKNNPTYTMLYYILAYMFFNTAYTLVAIPHTAMLPELAPEYFLRTQYKSVEYIMNSVGMISSFALVSITLGFFNMETLSPASRPKFAILGFILCLWFSLPLIITFKSTKEPSSLGMHLEPLDLKSLFREYVLVFKNKAFRQYFSISLLYMMCKGFYHSSNQYFIRYVAKRMKSYNVIQTIAGAAEASGFPLNYWLTKRFGKQTCGKLLSPLFVAGILINLFITENTPLIILIIGVILYNFGFSGTGFVISNIHPDVTDADELITGRRREGVVSTFNSFIKKSINGFMSAITGFTLTAFGFVTGKGDMHQTARGILGLKITYIALPATFAILSFISIFRYKMSKSDHQMIKRVIAEKKETGKANITDEQRGILEQITGQKFENMWIGGAEEPARKYSKV
ncbi:MAG: MFS transporter [Clostridiales bacterium]|nr:MFS transporter [Clostridiales bacterium]